MTERADKQQKPDKASVPGIEDELLPETGTIIDRQAARRTLTEANWNPDAILRLQSILGNRAVQRMLPERSHQRTPTTPSVQRQSRGPIRIPRFQDVIITTVGTPVQAAPGGALTTHGSFTWYVTYSLPQAATADGYIIQELSMIHEDLLTGQITPQHFFEQWPVRAGQRQVHNRVGPYDDRYVHGDLARTPGGYGRNRHIGVVRFFESPCPFPSCVPGASSTTAPPYWTGAGTTHNATATWDYRPGHPNYNNLTLIAGSTVINLP